MQLNSVGIFYKCFFFLSSLVRFLWLSIIFFHPQSPKNETNNFLRCLFILLFPRPDIRVYILPILYTDIKNSRCLVEILRMHVRILSIFSAPVIYRGTRVTMKECMRKYEFTVDFLFEKPKFLKQYTSKSELEQKVTLL